jgi:hypothetical protein
MCLLTTSSSWGKAAQNASRPFAGTYSAPSTKCSLNRPRKRPTGTILLKKLLKGDGSWNTQKLILGWIMDTICQTIELPPHRKETLALIFEELVSARRVNSKKWAGYLGKLRFVSVAIPGSAGLFSALQWAQNKAKGNRIRVNRFV